MNNLNNDHLDLHVIRTHIPTGFGVQQGMRAARKRRHQCFLFVDLVCASRQIVDIYANAP